MVVFVTCKNEEDPIKNEGVKVVTTLSINFQDSQDSHPQGQLTPKSVMESCRKFKPIQAFMADLVI